MRSRRIHNHVRVLMLGWEYPPRFAGGLGKACQGLAQGMSKRGARVFFVLPTFPPSASARVSIPHLEVVGAREVIEEAGIDPDALLHPVFGGAVDAMGFSLPQAGHSGARESIFQVEQVIRSAAKLFPYGTRPEGPVPQRLLRSLMMHPEDPGIEGIETTPWSPRLGKMHLKPGLRLISRLRLVGDPEQRRGAVHAEAEKTQEIYGRNLWSEIAKFAASVRHLGESHEVDVVHAHDWMTFPAAFEFSRVTGTPVFLHVHATEYDRTGEYGKSDVFRIEMEGFKRAKHIFAVSRYTAGILEQLYGVPKRKITVIYNAPEDQYKVFEPEAEGVKRSSQVVFLGRLTFQKGPDHFLKAAALVAQANDDARFIFCGTGDMLEQLRVQAHQLGIEDRVHFAGFIHPAAVDEILRESRVLVMPSVSEPFGLVALEAVHCGIPTIISKQSGVREVLQRALQVDFWDVEKLADQILAALRLRALSRQLVNEGMEQVRQLSWEKSAQKVIETYHRYLKSTYAQAVEGAHGH